MHELTHLDTYSGIGGFSVAFEAEGFHTIGFSEIDEEKCLVLADQWPGVPNYGTVEGITPERVGIAPGRLDVLTGGVPCQPASALGQMRGTADPRWQWPTAIGLVRRFRPRFGVFENPPSLLVLEGGRAWNGIVSELVALRYDLWWDVFPAAAFGAGHLRERVILVIADADNGVNRQRCDGAGHHRSTEQAKQTGANDWENDAADATRIGERITADEADAEPNGGRTRVESGGDPDVPDGIGCGPASKCTDPFCPIHYNGPSPYANDAGLEGHAGNGAHGNGRAGKGRPIAAPDLRGTTSDANEFDGDSGRLRAGEVSQQQTTGLQGRSKGVLQDLRGRVFATGRGEPPWWHEAHTGIPVLAHGLPAKLVEAATRCTGDAVLPQAVQPIARAIKAILTA